MTPDDFFKKIAAHRGELARAGVRRLGVYGSVARDEARPDSDVDILVEFDRTPDLFEFAALRDRLTRRSARSRVVTMLAFLPSLARGGVRVSAFTGA
jgi:hypothetical protein